MIIRLNAIPSNGIVVGNDLVKCCRCCLATYYNPLGYYGFLCVLCMSVRLLLACTPSVCNCYAYFVVSPMDDTCRQFEDTLKHASKTYRRRIDPTTTGGHWTRWRLGIAPPTVLSSLLGLSTVVQMGAHYLDIMPCCLMYIMRTLWLCNCILSTATCVCPIWAS